MRDYFPLDSVTAVAISGKDRLKWLNNLVTNDLKSTSEKRAVECFITDVKGRTLAHGIVFSDRESLVFFSWGKDQATKIMAHWDRYIIREDVTLADASTQWRWAFAQRGWMKTQWKCLCDEAFANMDVAVLDSSTSAMAIACPVIGDEWLLVRFDEAGSIGQVLCERSHDLREEDAIALEDRRIHHRWPLVGIDFDEKNLPQELDRNATAISFNKGCYLGQETVARLDALGQVQKKLVLLSIDSGDLTKLPIFEKNALVKMDEQDAGVITSWARSSDDAKQAIALAYIRRAYFTRGTELRCNGFRATVQ